MRTITFILYLLPIGLLAQVDESVTLPQSQLVFIKGIKTRVTLLHLEGMSSEMTAHVIFIFTNPITGEEVSFEAEKAPFDTELGFVESFELRSKNSADLPDMQFLQKLIYRSNSKYIWRCVCQGEISIL
jgi:hypothetical protein